MRNEEIYRTSQKVHTTEEQTANSINAIVGNRSNRFTTVALLSQSAFTNKTFDKFGQCRVLQLVDDHNYNEVYAVLTDAWASTPFKVGMGVSVYGKFKEEKDRSGNSYLVILISQKEPSHYLILYPARSLAVTGLKEASNCDRKIYLRSVYSTLARQNHEAAIKGTIYHNIFELVLLGKITGENREQAASLVSQQILRESNFFLTPDDEAKYIRISGEMMGAVTVALGFKQTYLVDKEPINYKDGKIVIESLVDTEHAFNSYNFGFSGKVDVLFKCKYYPVRGLRGSSDIYVPFELKTGKHKDAIFYNDQAMIYNFCLHDDATKDGLSMVYYSIDGEIVVVENDFKRFGDALRGRNYAVFVMNDDKPPKVLRDKHMCTNCIQLSNCTVEFLKDKFEAKELNFKGSEDKLGSETKKKPVGDSSHRGVSDDSSTKKAPKRGSLEMDEFMGFMDEVSQQQTELDAEHNRNMDRNPTVEIEDLCNLKLGIEDKIKDLSSRGRLTYRNLFYLKKGLKSIGTDEAYKKAQVEISGATVPSNYSFSFSNLQTLIRLISSRELIDEAKTVSPELEVRINRTTRNDIDDLLNDFHKDKVIVVYNSIIFHLKLEGKVVNRDVHQYPGFCILRLFLETDRRAFEVFVKEFNGAYSSKYYSNWLMVKDEKYYYSLMRLNLSHMLTSDSHESLIRILVDGSGKDRELVGSMSQHADEDEIIRTLEVPLNYDQRKAVLSSVIADTFWTVNGYSGTGKKQVVVALLKRLLMRGERTLLVGNNFTTINAILAKMATYLTPKQKDEVLRMMGGVHNNTAGYPVFTGSSSQTIQDMREYNKKTVFCATIQNLGRCRFADLDFKYVIVVEASDIPESIVLQALYLGEKRILVGDSKLSVLTNEGVRGGLDRSLFDNLHEKYPLSMTQLIQQYKHSADLSEFLNKTLYDGSLKNGQGVQDLVLPPSQPTSQCQWMASMLARGLVLLNTEGLVSRKMEFRLGLTDETSVTRQTSFVKTEIEKAVDVYNYYLTNGLTHADMLLVVEDYNQQGVIKGVLEKADVCLLNSIKGKANDVVFVVLCFEGMLLSSSDCARIAWQIRYVVSKARKQAVIITNLDKIRSKKELIPILEAIRESGLIIDIKKEEIEEYIGSCPF